MAAIGAVTCVGALVAALAVDASPTASPVIDALYRAGLVGSCALAGSRARRWTLLWAAIVTSVAGMPPLQFVAAATGAAVIVMFALHRRHRVIGALIGATVGVAALDLGRPEQFGATALVAAIALTPLLVSGFRHSRSRSRRVIAIAAVAAALWCVAATVATTLFALSQREAVETAIDQTRAAVDDASSQDTASTITAFDTASASFEDVTVAGDAWWLVPARFVPVLGPNLQFTRAAVDAGADLNRVAGQLSTSIDQTALRSPTGGIDLRVLASMQEPVTTAVDQIAVARTTLESHDSPWLVGPLREGLDELLGELGSAEDSAGTAQLAVDRAPQILGADGPRRYLMLLGNPAESRDIGGHIGNWAEVVADNGVLSVSTVGQPYDLAGPATSPPLSLTPGAYPQSLVELRPQYFPQNWGGSPDFPTVAALARELFMQSRPGQELDGVIYADPSAFAALLNFTGPQPVAGTDIVLTPENAAAFFTTDQFTVFDTETEGNQVVSGLIEAVMERFGTAQLPSPQRMAEVLGPVVREGRLQFVSFDDADTPLLDRIGLSGAVERPGSGDLLSVLTRNTNPSKVDVYLQRSTEYSVDWDPITGEVDARLIVTLTNDAPAGGLPTVVGGGVPGLAPGTNRTTLSVLSPWAVDGVTLDGAPTTFGTQQELRGVRRNSVLVDLAPGATRAIEFELVGNVGPGAPYLLQWIGQPAVLPSTVSVDIRRTAAAPESATSSVSRTVDGAEDDLIRVAVDPS